MLSQREIKGKQGSSCIWRVIRVTLVSLIKWPYPCSYEEHQRCLMDQIAMPGTALRFEVDTVFRAADVKTQTLCMSTQVTTTLQPSARMALAFSDTCFSC